jgi:hypothetical protein
VVVVAVGTRLRVVAGLVVVVMALSERGVRLARRGLLTRAVAVAVVLNLDPVVLAVPVS